MYTTRTAQFQGFLDSLFYNHRIWTNEQESKYPFFSVNVKHIGKSPVVKCVHLLLVASPVSSRIISTTYCRCSNPHSVVQVSRQQMSDLVYVALKMFPPALALAKVNGDSEYFSYGLLSLEGDSVLTKHRLQVVLLDDYAPAYWRVQRAPIPPAERPLVTAQHEEEGIFRHQMGRLLQLGHIPLQPQPFAPVEPCGFPGTRYF